MNKKTWPISCAGGVYSLVPGERLKTNIYKIMLEISTVERRDRWAIVEGH